jgi:hypothetical protein
MHAVHWIYLPEVLNDTQFGFIATMHYIGGMEVAIVTEFMVKWWKAEGTFLFLSLITFVGSTFFIFIVKETSGLTDKEKKQLYWPDHLKETEMVV